eukprot:SAG22_NODE_33_length_27588_cov_104.174652_24_plen_167_part_00
MSRKALCLSAVLPLSFDLRQHLSVRFRCHRPAGVALPWTIHPAEACYGATIRAAGTLPMPGCIAQCETEPRCTCATLMDGVCLLKTGPNGTVPWQNPNAPRLPNWCGNGGRRRRRRRRRRHAFCLCATASLTVYLAVGVGVAVAVVRCCCRQDDGAAAARPAGQPL